MGVQQDIIKALLAEAPDAIIEPKGPRSFRVSLPGGPGMVIHDDYYARGNGEQSDFQAYAERIIGKIREEML